MVGDREWLGPAVIDGRQLVRLTLAQAEIAWPIWGRSERVVPASKLGTSSTVRVGTSAPCLHEVDAKPSCAGTGQKGTQGFGQNNRGPLPARSSQPHQIYGWILSKPRLAVAAPDNARKRRGVRRARQRADAAMTSSLDRGLGGRREKLEAFLIVGRYAHTSRRAVGFMGRSAARPRCDIPG
jgi:hypothetical protein